MSDYIFRVRNHQSAACVDSPIVDDADASGRVWQSYFENECGEQWICTYDKDTRITAVYGGIFGWKNPLRITTYNEIAGVMPPDVAATIHAADKAMDLNAPLLVSRKGVTAVGAAEQKWIEACWAVIRSLDS